MVGKRIAINSLGGTYYLAFRQKLLSEGLDPNSMTFLAMPFSQMGGALVTGEVDAAIMLRTEFVRTQERQALRTIMTESEYTGNDISTATLLVARADWLEQNEDKIIALLKAFLKTNLFMQEDRLNNDGAATIAAIDGYMSLPPGVAKLYYEVRGGYAGLELDYVNWMEVPSDAVDTYNQLLQDGNMLQGRDPVPYELAVDSSYLRRALPHEAE